MMAAERQSNIELLRILSMMAVITVHLDGASLGLPTPGSLAGTSASDAWRIAVESITIVGVNCFTLISGYFGIRARVAGFLKFTLMCMFYSVGIYTAFAIYAPSAWSWKGWFESWMVFSHTDLWYVPAYMLLYLLSPMLNSAISSISRQQFRLWLGLFVIANIWCGWLWEGNFNPTGYTVIQLIMMYLIGRYISLERDVIKAARKKIRFLSAAVYGTATAVTALLAVWLPPTMVYAYNSPWVIVSSVSLFICFLTLRVQSETINNLAKGAFAAYLIHKNPLIWGNIVRPIAVRVWNLGSLTGYTVFCMAFTAAIYLTSSAADFIRRQLFGKIETLLDNKVKIKL